MSHIKWIPLPEAKRRSSWQFFPWMVAAGMLVVIAVNVGMVYAALKTFPGETVDAGYTLSNHYNAVLDQAGRQTSLGWMISVSANETRRPVVSLADRDGKPLLGARIIATAERPLGALEQRQITFVEMHDGRYAADMALPTAGQWDLTVQASAEGQKIAVTRRLLVQ